MGKEAKLNPLYIFQDGFLRRKDNTLVLEGEEKKKYIPVENLLEIKVFGEMDINKRALEFLSTHQIPVHFFNRYGHFIGSFVPIQHNTNGSTILKQAEFYSDSQKRLGIARKFVSGAMENMGAVCSYYSRRGKTLGITAAEVKVAKHQVEKSNTISELMAMEGQFREKYYAQFDRILENEDFQMEKRTRQPPQNHLNTLISFGNSVLYSTVLTEILKTPLDPRIGFLHSTNFRRHSLNLDIAEIFKPIIVDRSIFQVVNRKQIGPEHFRGVENGIYLNQEGKKEFLKAMEDHLRMTIHHERLKRKVSFKSLIRHEGYKLIKHMIENREYDPYKLGA
ncbi:MAG TPA: type I-B CRISPR-associated endonuclease Cas1b [Thermotogota bacterium]|nr:type I-B CRISPR-associated endonuclease Cas1b [Thermotogota bacterium]HRW93814.1 type I-B CRISPR-associated endonuclease Cas1b [Thermotogota bacterium]